MALAHLTDPGAVDRAIEEFDRLGRTAFLAKYGFGRAREYMLRDARGNLYDSKAVVGAAHGFQHPDLGALRPDDFSGGEATVERKLRELGFEVVRIGEDWTEEEVRLTVADYFQMLALESRGETYNKAAHNAALRAQLRARSKGSVELKHQNVSAVLAELGLPYIAGYKPRANVQDLLRQTVRQYLSGHTAEVSNVLDGFEEAVAPGDRTYEGVLVATPRPESLPDPASHPRERIPRKLDYASRDDRNRKLGELGEAWVVGYETVRLKEEGRGKLIEGIDWVARRLGDGLGYDVKSFQDAQTPRYIEVKTTNGPALTPFIVSQNELEFSQEQDAAFWLYRVFDFRALPRLFLLQGALDRHVSLTPTDYRARLRAST